MLKHTVFPAINCLPFLTMFLPNKMKPASVKPKKKPETKQRINHDDEESLPIRMRGLS